MISRCTELWKTHPRPSSIIHNTEAAEGNHILNSKNVSGSFFIEDCEDVKNCFSLYGPVKTSQDFSFFGKDSELLYEAAQCGIGDSAVVLSFDCWGNNSNLLYCWMCEGCHDCFGCVGLQKKQFCVLNKQYSKDEYHALVPKIIEHMRQTKEFGEFFPMTLSPIPYNHSVAQRYFPQTPDTTRQQGCVWYEQNTENVKQAIESSSLPDGVPTSDDAIVVKSLKSGRPFRITTQEIKRYRQMQVPLPRWTYDERMEDRIAMLGGITLHERTCDKTKKPMLTTYLPDTEFPVWEREIYNRELRG